MLQYILEQPAMWQNMLKSWAPIHEAFLPFLTDGKIRRFVAIGSGSSYNAAKVAQTPFGDWCGKALVPAVPTQLREVMRFSTPEDTVLLFISQSGESTATLEMIEAYSRSGYQTIALCGSEDASIAKKAHQFIPILLGEETIGPKTKGFTATVLTLYMMALAPDTGSFLKAMEQAALNASQTLALSKAFIHSHEGLLAAARHMILIADGVNAAISLEGALKILETLYVPVFPYEFEEYLHGVQLSLNQDSLLLLVLPPEGNRQRMLKLYDFAKDHGAKCLLLNYGEKLNDPLALNIPATGDAWTLVFETLLPMQLIGAMISTAKDIDCDKSRFPEFYGMLNTKVQK